MELEALIAALRRPEVYPAPPLHPIEVRQTHISAVFLVDDLVYKLKKPVDLGFLDFSTLEKRLHFCREEVRLNRRLAPQVYVDVVPITLEAEGLRVGRQRTSGGTGPVVDWLVQMRRLPEAATFEQRLERGELGPAQIDMLAGRLARFHAAAETGPHISRYGRFEVVSRNLLENFEATAAHVGQTVALEVFERARDLVQDSLERMRPVIESRAERDIPRDTHGDLHLDHIYLLPEPPPHDLVIIDCIEFTDRFRYADPISDMAFVAMDLQFHGAHDLARLFCERYFAASDDVEGRGLLPMYVAYRAMVRAKVDGLKMLESEVPEAERAVALQHGRAHWLVALGNLEQPQRVPCLILVGGLPGSGKSTLARELAAAAGCTVIRSDVVRKELAGMTPEESGAAGFQQGIYSREWTDRTYAECLQRGEALLFAGQRVIVDASFADEQRRQDFLGAAVRWGVRGLFLECRADPQTIHARLAARSGDASDADWDVYQQAARHWDPASLQTEHHRREVSTETDVADAVQSAAGALRAVGLL